MECCEATQLLAQPSPTPADLLALQPSTAQQEIGFWHGEAPAAPKQRSEEPGRAYRPLAGSDITRGGQRASAASYFGMYLSPQGGIRWQGGSTAFRPGSMQLELDCALSNKDGAPQLGNPCLCCCNNRWPSRH